MRKLIFAFTAGLILAAGFAFTENKFYDQRTNTAEVEQFQGLFVFTDAKPVGAYDYLGTEKFTWGLNSGQYSAVRDKLIKKVKKDHPTANGVIFHFSNGGTDRADAILLK